MQTEPGRYRYRGWRQSRDLVEVAKSVPADVADLLAAQLDNEGDYEAAVPAPLALANQTRVSEIQHYRTQVRHRLLNRD